MVQQLAARGLADISGAVIRGAGIAGRWQRDRDRQVDGLQNKLAAALGRAGFHLHRALRDAAGARPLQPQRLQLAKPPLIALASCRDALARPFRLGGDAAVHLVKHHRLLGDNALGPAVELREIPLTAAQPAIVQPDDAGAKIAQEGAIMADHQQRAAMLAQHLLHPFDGRHVHMVCRLVEKQHVGLGIERAGQRHAA